MERLGMVTCINVASKIKYINGRKLIVRVSSLWRGLGIQLLSIKIPCSFLGVGTVMILWMIFSSIVFCQITGMKFIELMALHPSHVIDIQVWSVGVTFIYLEELILTNTGSVMFINLISIKEGFKLLKPLEMPLSQGLFIELLFIEMLCT